MDDFEEALQVDVLACSLRRWTKTLLEIYLSTWALKLSQPCLKNAKLQEAAGFYRLKPVTDLSLKLEDTGYQFTREKRGTITARRQKIVRGVVLKSEEVPVEALIQELAIKLASLAEELTRTREALQKFVVG